MIFCRHEWDKISETTLPSAFEQMPKDMQTRITKTWGNMFGKAHIVILTCKKCGKVEKMVTQS